LLFSELAGLETKVVVFAGDAAEFPPGEGYGLCYVVLDGGVDQAVVLTDVRVGSENLFPEALLFPE